jgi:hypothetical protein
MKRRSDFDAAVCLQMALNYCHVLVHPRNTQVAYARRLVNFIVHFTLLPIRGYAAGDLNN